jgi:2-dehydro-3-deoxyphosphogluconate aldolase / (4S)-4-hydroxy-2-oxoglutarate aldolase
VDLLAALKNVPVIAILRSRDASRLAEVSNVLAEAGITAIEFTLTTSGAIDALREYARAKPESVVLGAGTVLDAAMAEAAVEAGATYLITPAVRPAVVEAAHRLDVPVIPGALTPTEILGAWESGVTAVKVFPAPLVGGPDYLKAVLAPLPHIPLIPTGGVGIDDARAYLDAGATAVGVGNPLLGDALDGGSLDAVRERAERLVAAVAG